ncbi:hypothetical protein [Accumulibacter sp.]|uniref:hypothetical protein n=1 Tax=Accumulibacter sp. TaxID=2053492 RepID=UPI0026243E90|nr:hypothetical protein [Accumulibacter sp.]
MTREDDQGVTGEPCVGSSSVGGEPCPDTGGLPGVDPVKGLDKATGDARLIEAAGPWPFITRYTVLRADGRRAILHSRRDRKGLLPTPATGQVATAFDWRCLWMPRQLNWWIGSVFALGSLLFALGSVFSLAPDLARRYLLDARAVNAIYFAGSIPFTIAAYLQLFQAANARRFALHTRPMARQPELFGWRPREIGWLSCALQFAGTLLFNVSTFDAMLPGLNWFRQDLATWAPDLFGSILFLASGYLALIETCHAYWAWRPSSLSWWLAFSNFLGCVAFMISALFAFVPSHAPSGAALTISLAFTLAGALGFLAGSLLMLPETAKPAESAAISNDPTG